MNVAGKFVFLGITAPGIMPQIATPTGLLEPHKIQAALSESILIENSPRIPEWSLVAEILIFGIFALFAYLLNLYNLVKLRNFATIAITASIFGYSLNLIIERSFLVF